MKKFDGNLEINSTNSIEIFSDFHVAGDFIVDLSDAEALYFPLLKEVEGDLIIKKTSLIDIDLPSLVHIGGKLNISSNNYLKSIHMPSLTTVDGEFSVHSNVLLPLLSLPTLDSVNNFYVAENANLVAFSFPSAKNIKQPSIIDKNPRLPQEYIQNLKSQLGEINSIKGQITISRVHGDEREVVRIAIRDTASHSTFVIAELEPRDFAEAILGLAETKCSLEFREE